MINENLSDKPDSQTDQPSTANTPKEIIRVSISEASRLFGVNTQTVRRAISAGEITYIVVSGRYKLNFESLVKWSQRKTTVRNKLANKGIGQFISSWRISNPLYSPNPKVFEPKKKSEITKEKSNKKNNRP
ncbi:MAG: hypothetical protein COU31_04590 [Candidatus Magasanikbacteria bacterium CG10_big_fil_rev_8_21_14_0_10_40_10]|uniref:Helix-turn-helix domain-containing protein n=1 Tax=Candidatus Magasanikbacteria bacterium CG10_big_fil_rev_8_21_14_0_10_40_10 TaxID=1974648 RepID=A0A2M6W2W2_9BACT|nr:MAG: hypothetical protein COU31_04590 [Candidatus Magasanikbacteria bacterium CG10_big_fil_rev_8_21_14_0_10_40_10]